MSDVAAQVEAGLRYIRETYGKLTPEQAEGFYEEDEDPGKVFAAYDAGPKGLTASPGSRHEYNCGFCERGACGRCSDPRCACCAGNPDSG